MGRVVITGGTGLIGRALAAELARNKYEVIVLTRNASHAHHLPVGVRAQVWDGKTANGWGELVNGATAIVNLAGENIGTPPIPWTNERRRRIQQSRTNSGNAVVEAVANAQQKPQVVVQSSAVGYYGLHGDEVLTEESSAGKDFMSRVAVDWEASTAPVESMGVRRVVLRSGVVLSPAGGVLPYLTLPFRFFVGGPIGNGKQWVSWVHIADEVGAIRFLIEKESASGVYNLTAPNPLRNRDLERIIGQVMHRPSLIPVPGFAMKLALGELAELLLLGGQRVAPKRLQEAGYQFCYPDAEGALENLVHSGGV